MTSLIILCAWLLTLSLVLFALAIGLRLYRRAQARREAVTVASARRKLELACFTERTQMLDLSALRRLSAQAAEEEARKMRRRHTA